MSRTETRVKERAKIPFAAPHVFTLSSVRGPDVTAVHRLLQPETVVGRDPDADIVIDDPEVSARHCELRVDAGVCRITDLESKNGTLVNGRPLRPGVWERLRHLDEIELGGTCLLFLSGRFKQKR